MQRRLTPWFRTVAAIFAMAAAAALTSASARAQDSFTLAGNPDVRADRMALIREELRERKHEIKEALESARKNRKARPNGKKAEHVVGEEDLAPAALRAGQFASPFGAARAFAAPTNTKANDKTADAAGAGQAEQSIAFWGQYGVCSWNDGQGFNLTPQDVQGWGYTVNGGATWTDGGIPQKGGTIATWSSDPVVTVNEKTGEFYINGLTTNTGTNNNGVGVARGHFVGSSWVWDGTSVVASGPSASQFFDKQWMCADSTNGNLYVTWTLFTTTSEIFFARSTDGGNTWSAPVKMSGSWENGLVSGSRPMVGPNGELYVIYTAIGPVDADSIKIRKSTDGGLTFSPSVAAMVEYDNYFTGAPGFNRPRAVTFAAGAVDRSFGPNRGRVYLTVQDAVNFYGDAFLNTGSKSEVENNGNFGNATPFTVGNIVRGSVSSSTDIDNFKFTTVAGTTYLFYVDSLRTTSFRYTMRLYCGNDTTVLSRLALSGAQSTTSALNSHSLIVWTAPTSGNYYLRIQPVTVGSGANNYRIRCATHTAVASDVARDARDVVMASSPDGLTGWTARKVINDDAAINDNWLPEIAVSCDGNVYAMWMDFRDYAASCYGGSNIYVTRSTNGGGTWAANQVATTAGTPNWTQVSSNISPNQGDYNGMYGGDAIGLAFADGRLGDSDVFTARVPAGFSLSGCPGNQTVDAGTGFSGSVSLTNNNMMFANGYSWTLTCDQPWPGLPASGTASASAGGSTSIPVAFTVPGSATHLSVAHFVLTVNCGGGCAQTCAFDVTVNNIATPTLASLSASTAEAGRVSLTWQVDGAAAAHVYRSEDGVEWTMLGDATVAGDGTLRFVDSNVRAASRYAYRLGLLAGGQEVFAGQGWVEIPAFTEFAVHGAFPNPAKAGFAVSFSLPTNAPATLDVIDLAGRRVVSKPVGAFGAGRHTLSLQTETGRLPIGVYGIRLTQAGKVSTGKVSVVR